MRHHRRSWSRAENRPVSGRSVCDCGWPWSPERRHRSMASRLTERDFGAADVLTCCCCWTNDHLSWTLQRRARMGRNEAHVVLCRTDGWNEYSTEKSPRQRTVIIRNGTPYEPDESFHGYPLIVRLRFTPCCPGYCCGRSSSS